MADAGADAPFEFRAPLTVCLDVKHPEAYLAVGPVRALARELAVAVDWLPFPAAGMKPPPAEASATDRGVRHRQMRARYREADVRRYAAVQGRVLGDLYRDPDTRPASLAMLWLRDTAPHRLADFIEQLYGDYWRETLDVASVAALAVLLGEFGADGGAFRRFAAGPGPAALAGLRRRLVAAGVFAVPSLVVEDEVFVGRAHLPMVRWRLTGRAGPPPI